MKIQGSESNRARNGKKEGNYAVEIDTRYCILTMDAENSRDAISLARSLRRFTT